MADYKKLSSSGISFLKKHRGDLAKRLLEERARIYEVTSDPGLRKELIKTVRKGTDINKETFRKAEEMI